MSDEPLPTAGRLIERLQAEGAAHRSVDDTSEVVQLRVDGHQLASLESLLTSMGFKRLRRAGGKEGGEYLGFDETTGKLVTLGLRESAGSSHGNDAGRQLAGGGVLIALVGSRGSGKTTVCDALLRWLTPALAVRRVYFGSGDGPVSMLRWPLRTIQRTLARGGRGGSDSKPAKDRSLEPRTRGARSIPGFGLVEPLWAMLVSREKSRALAGAWRARADGLVVICDRYPQNEIAGLNDGPLLTRWLERSGGLLRFLAGRERRPYSWAQGHPPDLVIRLRVSEAMSRQRRPQAAVTGLTSRIDAVERLTFGDTGKIVDVDADMPLDRVILAVKRRVWGAL